MIAWRIAKQAHALDRTGTGAALTGGRWNDKNVPAIYAGLTLTISVLEKFVHISGVFPKDLCIVEIELPDAPQLIYRPNPLPSGWDALPSSPSAAKFGTTILQSASYLAFIVPSVVVPEAENIVINPQHGKMAQVTMKILRPFEFDLRMQK